MAVTGTRPKTRLLRDIDRAFARLMNHLQDAYDGQLRLAMKSRNEKVREDLQLANDRVRGLIAQIRSLLESRPLL